jgi:hypothetical protein
MTIVFDREIFIGDEVVTIDIDLGNLVPGRYVIKECKNIEKLIKQCRGIIADAHKIKWRPSPNCRHFTVDHLSNCSYSLSLQSKSSFLREHPTLHHLERDKITNYGEFICDKDYDNYPNCKFINDIASAGVYRITIELLQDENM